MGNTIELNDKEFNTIDTLYQSIINIINVLSVRLETQHEKNSTITLNSELKIRNSYVEIILNYKFFIKDKDVYIRHLGLINEAIRELINEHNEDNIYEVTELKSIEERITSILIDLHLR